MTDLRPPEIGTAVEPPSNATVPTCPFVGPRSIGVDDRLDGRATEVGELRDRLIADRIVLLYSPSGAGKTSVINAGLRPELTRRGFAVLPAPITDPQTGRRAGGAVRLNLPAPAGTNRFLFSAKQSLEAGRPPEARLDPGELDAMTFAEYLTATRGDVEADTPRCLVFDQFEELVTTDPTDHDAQVEFVRQLGEALRDRRVWALFAMREDYLAAIDDHRRALPTQLQSRFRLDLLTAAAAESVLVATLEPTEIGIDRDVARRLVDALRQVRVVDREGPGWRPGRYVEPVQLQVVGMRLWDHVDETTRRITPEMLDRIGDVDDALAAYYSDRVAEIADELAVPEREIRDWFESELITPSGFRSQTQSFERDGDTETGLEVIAALVDCHLVRSEVRGDQRWFELAHDRLVAPVLSSNARARGSLQPLQIRSSVWKEAGSPDRLLMTGAELRAARSWAENNPDELNADDRAYLSRSVDRSKRTRRFWVVGVLAVVAVVAAILLFIRQTEIDADRRRVADELTATGLAQQSAGLAASDPGLALAIAGQSAGVTDPPTPTSLAGIVDARSLLRDRPWTPRPGSPITAEEPRRVAVGTDGLAAWGDVGGSITVVDLSGPGVELVGEPLRLHAGSRITGLAFRGSLDDTESPPILASSSRRGGNPVVLVDPITQMELARIDVDGVEVLAIAFRPGADELAVGDAAGGIRLCSWPAGECAPFDASGAIGENEQILDLAFDETGRFLVSASSTPDRSVGTGSVVVWDVDERAAATRLERTGDVGDEAGALSVAVSAESVGPIVVAGDVDGRIWVWDDPLEGGSSPIELNGHPDDVTAVAFDSGPSGRFVSTGSQSDRILTWQIDRTTGGELLVDTVDRPLTAHSGAVDDLALGDGGVVMVSASSRDGTVRLWSRATADGAGLTSFGSPTAPCDPACWTRGVAFASSDVVVSIDGTARLSAHSVDGELIESVDLSESLGAPTEGFAVAVRSPADGADDVGVVAAAVKGAVIAWDPDDPERVDVLWEHTDQRPVRTVSFDPATGLLASGDDCGWVRTWNLDAGLEPVGEIDTTPDTDCSDDGRPGIGGVAFDDGRLWVTGSDGLVAHLDVSADGTIEGPPIEHRVMSGNVRAVATSDDGALIAIGGDTQTIAVVDPDVLAAATSDRLTDRTTRLDGHGDEIGSIRIGAARDGDGLRLIASASNDGTVRLWWLDPNDRVDDEAIPVLAAGAELPPSRPCPRDERCFSLGVAISPDGTTVASVGADGLVHVWPGLIDPAEACRLAESLTDQAAIEAELGAIAYRSCDEL